MSRNEYSIQIWPDGRSGHISYRDNEVYGDFYMEMNATGPTYSICIPLRRLDKYFAQVKSNIEAWIKETKQDLDIVEVGGNHNLYRGKTVNERLVLSELATQFDSAMVKKNKHKIREILEEIEVDDMSIDRTIDGLG